MASIKTISSFAASTAIALMSSTALAQDRPNIAVFSGPTATIQNSLPLVTSNIARAENGLPLLMDGAEPRVDVLRMQRLAAPVTLYVEQFSAHPLEADAAELYGPPDGYIDSNGEFHTEPQSPDDVPVYEITLNPEDGLYPLPYMALTADGSAWDSACLYPGAPPEACRQTFYPDASRIFEEIERMGGRIYMQADYDFYRALPAGGYTQGLPEAERTDVGEGDIPPETLNEDFFPYGQWGGLTPRWALARATNVVQAALSTGDYDGAIWLEGTPDISETVYWLNLLIDTNVPIAANAAQRARYNVSADGERNIMDSITYLTSDIWADEDGNDMIGAVLIQAQEIFTARDVQKGDARPGGYVATGGYGGVIGNVSGPNITYVPNRLHTASSEVNLTSLPESVMGVVRTEDGGVTMAPVQIKDEEGYLLDDAIPMVSMLEAGGWFSEGGGPQPADSEIDILARIEYNLDNYPLAGFVAEGLVPSGILPNAMDAALLIAVMNGMPVVKTSQGDVHAFVGPDRAGLFISGSNLTAHKARMLLMAALMKYGSLPLPADPSNPTPDEMNAIRAQVSLYQTIFDTH